ncbi:BspA family leucine-rich repeat surface protein [Massilicoli timonensis]|uniref:BspA family leucine-rich repeat surface protein n=1 Tax=Massilicoli timonensis TaxID=2015901 RepID=A0ABT1SJY6_9FIRM|nr:BspA family leucine-rich repeat surface protein [Massilicoli timonensis]MCQ5121534.1 BspA family leucine-rich repeat surface protein [Massilicoli timonensis]
MKVETTDKKVMLGTNTLAYAFDPTGDAVRNQYWFNKLVSIDLSGLDTSSVTNMAYMFAYCLFKTSQKLYNLVRHCL